MGKFSGKTCRLLSMLSMTASFFLVEIIVGYVTNSIALVADSFHMLSDVVALIVGFASVRISKWQTEKNTFGWARAEVLGAMVNAVFLVALCFSIMVEALKRLIQVEEVEDPKLMLIVGGLGLLVNVVGLFLFHNHGHSHGGGDSGHGHSHGGGDSGHSHEGGDSGHGHNHENGHSHDDAESEALMDNGVVKSRDPTNSGNRYEVATISGVDDVTIDIDNPKVEKRKNKTSSSSQLNMRGVFLHVLGDALGSVIVVISALAIWFVEGDWKYYLDPAMSIVMVIIILGTTFPLLKESGFILLQTVPSHIQVQDIKKKLEKVEGVLAVHEFHIWQLAGRRIIASAHIRCQNLHKYMSVAEKVKDLFHQEGIHSTTIQPEFDQVIPEDEIDFQAQRACMLECGPDKNCYTDTCCAPMKRNDSKKIKSESSSTTSSREGSIRKRSQEEGVGKNNSDSKLISKEIEDKINNCDLTSQDDVKT